MNRNNLLNNLNKDQWDFIIIGGGATGFGIAVDAASRRYHVLLLEQYDFGKGTSSRSTKLMHGGLRYLKQGHAPLVKEALKERGLILQNAPHLVKPLGFIIPNYKWLDKHFYHIGLKIYDLLSGRLNIASSKGLSRKETLQAIPTVKQEGLKGGILYYDAQFDDARLLVSFAETLVEWGGTPINYMQVNQLIKKNGHICGVNVYDKINKTTHYLHSRIVINATGIFSDTIRKLDDSHINNMVAPSQGVHLVADRSFLRSNKAIIIPQTDDGRVIFIIPWHKHTLMGTTDTPMSKPVIEPLAQEEEIDFILEHASRYLSKKINKEDILSVFAGLRPLVRASAGKKTSKLSRGHSIRTSSSGLVSIVGGKWTTYRKMGEDTVNQAIAVAQPGKRKCQTKNLPLHGWMPNAITDLECIYGSDALLLQELIRNDPSLRKPLHPELPYLLVQIFWAIKREMALTVEDVLARRTRALFLNAKAAIKSAPMVASMLANELKQDKAWEKQQIETFTALAKGYCIR